eukprot:Blabericola_migrator_1__12922@NODE_84_length_14850_cov_98_458703_g75_i0_p5_GENE_NODE_84_length_14850_cov_98_458703_g75_i0NODE_84_length_14850_cov_98_458703_g75_i0_p5_ORF_typecomplete_len385_score36_08_NODE_84_length_14850_cov_98_458703_g75_i040075161
MPRQFGSLFCQSLRSTSVRPVNLFRTFKKAGNESLILMEPQVTKRTGHLAVALAVLMTNMLDQVYFPFDVALSVRSLRHIAVMYYQMEPSQAPDSASQLLYHVSQRLQAGSFNPSSVLLVEPPRSGDSTLDDTLRSAISRLGGWKLANNLYLSNETYDWTKVLLNTFQENASHHSNRQSIATERFNPQHIRPRVGAYRQERNDSLVSTPRERAIDSYSYWLACNRCSRAMSGGMSRSRAQRFAQLAQAFVILVLARLRRHNMRFPVADNDLTFCIIARTYCDAATPHDIRYNACLWILKMDFWFDLLDDLYIVPITSVPPPDGKTSDVNEHFMKLAIEYMGGWDAAYKEQQRTYPAWRTIVDNTFAPWDVKIKPLLKQTESDAL